VSATNTGTTKILYAIIVATVGSILGLLSGVKLAEIISPFMVIYVSCIRNRKESVSTN
jgi:ABC-type lipoprotein release transport system permease subunit